MRQKPATKTQTRSITMNLLYEDLARAHSRERLEQARAERLGRHLARAQRLARQAERAAQAAKLHLARAL
jgi:hypothetical protein